MATMLARDCAAQAVNSAVEAHQRAARLAQGLRNSKRYETAAAAHELIKGGLTLLRALETDLTPGYEDAR